MNYKNHFLFSETYLNEVLGKMKKDEKSEYDNIFENIYSWYEEYRDMWILYEDVVIDTLEFEKTAEDSYRILRADVGTPVAVAYLLDRYEEGTLTLDELAEELEYKRLNSQYYFGNTKALKFISRI